MRRMRRSEITGGMALPFSSSPNSPSGSSPHFDRNMGLVGMFFVQWIVRIRLSCKCIQAHQSLFLFLERAVFFDKG